MTRGPTTLGGETRLAVGDKLEVPERSVFAICRARQEDVVVHDPNDDNLEAFIPGWLGEHAPAAPFVLFPVVRGESAEAVFCEFYKAGTPIALSTAALKLTGDSARRSLPTWWSDSVKGWIFATQNDELFWALCPCSSLKIVVSSDRKSTIENVRKDRLTGL